MLITTDKDQYTNDREKKLATEGPLSEKDEQGKAIERAQKLAAKALDKWRRLKGKITEKLKKSGH